MYGKSIIIIILDMHLMIQLVTKNSIYIHLIAPVHVQT